MRHFFQWGPIAPTPAARAQMMRIWDEAQEAMTDRLDAVAREIVTASRYERPGSKWSHDRINNELKVWGKSISEAKSPSDILVFLKRHFVNNVAFWRYRCTDGTFLSDSVLLLLEEESSKVAQIAIGQIEGVEDFDVKLSTRKDIFQNLSNKVFGYIEFAVV